MSAFWQKLNTWRPIDVTPSSTMTSFRLLLSMILSLPKTFTLPGIVSDLIDVPVKQLPPRDVSVEGKLISSMDESYMNAMSPSVSKPSGKTIDFKFLHDEKANISMCFSDDGRLISSSVELPNAVLPIWSIVGGNVMEVMPEELKLNKPIPVTV